MIVRGNNFSVCCLKDHTGEMRYLYEGIKTIGEAETLSQYAISRKRDDEIVIIIPGSNISIDKFPDYCANAIELSKKYNSDDHRIRILGPGRRLRNLLDALSTIISITRRGGDFEICQK